MVVNVSSIETWKSGYIRLLAHSGGNGREVNKSTIYKVWAQIKDPALDGKYSEIGNTGKI